MGALSADDTNAFIVDILGLRQWFFKNSFQTVSDRLLVLSRRNFHLNVDSQGRNFFSRRNNYLLLFLLQCFSKKSQLFLMLPSFFVTAFALFFKLLLHLLLHHGHLLLKLQLHHHHHLLHIRRRSRWGQRRNRDNRVRDLYLTLMRNCCR